MISPSLLFPRPIKESKKGSKSCHEQKHAVNKNVTKNEIDLDDTENKPPAASLARYDMCEYLFM